MKKQVFQKGNLVKVLIGHQIFDSKKGTTDISPSQVGRLAVIEYSYAEKYGGNDVDSYSIVFLDTGNSVAWKRTGELEFIEEGGVHLLEAAAGARAKTTEQNTDIRFIADKLEEGKLSSESILFLFDLIGFKSSFLKNGEFYCLFSDWAKLHPMFLHIRQSSSIEEARSIFTTEALAVLDVEKTYNAFMGI